MVSDEITTLVCPMAINSEGDEVPLDSSTAKWEIHRLFDPKQNISYIFHVESFGDFTALKMGRSQVQMESCWKELEDIAMEEFRL